MVQLTLGEWVVRLDERVYSLAAGLRPQIERAQRAAGPSAQR